jgi:arginase
MKRKPLTIIDAPSNLGLQAPAAGREPGTRHAPDALRTLGLHERLSPRNVLRVEAAAYQPDDGRTVGIRNVELIAEHAVRLADAVETAVRDGHFALVLGGDCSLLIGSALGLRRIGDMGLLFIDGHKDFYLPEQSSTGGAAGLDLALATGWGPQELTDIEKRGPYFQREHVASLGDRDDEPRSHPGIPQIGDAGFHYRPLHAVRKDGIEHSTRAALASIGAGRPYWIHFDVDAIDSELMPAVDSPQSDGLSWQEAEIMLRTALEGKAVGLQVTIYDPTRDPGLAAGRRLAALIASVLSG